MGALPQHLIVSTTPDLIRASHLLWYILLTAECLSWRARNLLINYWTLSDPTIIWLESADMHLDQDRPENKLPRLYDVLKAAFQNVKNLPFYLPNCLTSNWTAFLCTWLLFPIYSLFEFCLCERKLNQLKNEKMYPTCIWCKARMWTTRCEHDLRSPKQEKWSGKLCKKRFVLRGPWVYTFSLTDVLSWGLKASKSRGHQIMKNLDSGNMSDHIKSTTTWWRCQHLSLYNSDNRQIETLNDLIIC